MCRSIIVSNLYLDLKELRYVSGPKDLVDRTQSCVFESLELKSKVPSVIDS